MLILLEGPDGAGKTTLANRVCELTGAKLLHKGPPERDVISEYALDLQWYRPGQGANVVCDRWHLGELVYGPLLRGESRFTDATRTHVEKTLLARGALLAVLDPPVKVLRSRLADRGDDLIEPGQVGELVRSYREARQGTLLPVVRFEEFDVDFAAEVLAQSALHLEERYARLNFFLTYVGDVDPRFLLLGDTRNFNRGEPPEEAAFTPAPGTAGRYLLEALPDALRGSCGLANACEEDVAELYRVLGAPKTVALGVNADRACREAGVPHGSVPHPQFVRRFHHAASEKYGALIRETLDTGRDRIGWRP